MLQVHQTLIPTLRDQQILRPFFGLMLYQHVTQPDQNRAVVSDHAHQPDAFHAMPAGSPGSDEEKDCGGNAETSRDSEAMLLGRNSQIFGKKHEKANKATLDDAYT